MTRGKDGEHFFVCASIFSLSNNWECTSNHISIYGLTQIHSTKQLLILMIFMQEVVLITIRAIECQCDRGQAHANASLQTFAIAPTHKRMQTRLNERKSALAFATWAKFGFEHVRSKTFRTNYSYIIITHILHTDEHEFQLRNCMLGTDCPSFGQPQIEAKRLSEAVP